MKAKEQKEAPSPKEPREANQPSGLLKAEPEPQAAPLSDKLLDEIQLFKLMMRKEQEQKVPEISQPSAPEPTLTGPTLQEVESKVSGLARIREQPKISTILTGTLFPFRSLLFD
jgi:hypothetical protein